MTIPGLLCVCFVGKKTDARCRNERLVVRRLLAWRAKLRCYFCRHKMVKKEVSVHSIEGTVLAADFICYN
jgi:hypothetical protein